MRRGRLGLLVIAVVVLVLIAVVAAVVTPVGRWGCPSQAELERARTPDEVVAAFADRRVRLVPTALARAVVRDASAYRGAAAYRFGTNRATLFVLVCKARCVHAPQGLREIPIVVADRSRRHLRQFSTLGNNIAVFVTDNDGRSGRGLHARVVPVLNGLDAAVASDSRCYVG